MLGEMKPREIEDFLRSETMGRIGCHADGRTYIVPITYAYDSPYVYCHSPEGLKLHMMRKNPVVCFEVDRIEAIGSWQSVIATGRFEELGGREALAAMDILIARFTATHPAREEHPSYVLRASDVESSRADGRPIVLFRILLAEKTGRFERVAD